jgi:cytochrome P450
MAVTLTLDASDPRFYEERNREAYLQIHSTDPVYRVEAAHAAPFWNVCRHDLIREVGKNVDLFTTEYGVHLENTAFQTAGSDATEGLIKALRPANILPPEQHRRVRAPLNPHFRHNRVARLTDQVRAIVRSLLDQVPAGEEVDFMRVFAARVPVQVTAALLGVSTERERDFASWADVILTSFEPGSTPDWEAIAAMGAFFTSEIAARRAHPTDDLISAMLDSELEDDEVLMWCCILLAAGIETTGNTIGGGMDLLLSHPEQMQRVVADRSLIRQALSEMLRVLTPGRYIRRTATADTELGGHAIGKGEAVVMNFTVANYDPVMFPVPLCFDIDRNPNEALAFSYGPHRCVGMAVARLQIGIAFEELLTRFPRIEARGRAEVRPSTATAVVERLPVVFRESPS